MNQSLNSDNQNLNLDDSNQAKVEPIESKPTQEQIDLQLLSTQSEIQKSVSLQSDQVSQIIDKAIDDSTSDTLEGGLFLKIAENLLTELFSPFYDLKLNPVEKNSKVRQRLQLLISNLTGETCKLRDIEELKVKLGEVLLRNEELQTSNELLDFADIIKVDYFKIILSLLKQDDLKDHKEKLQKLLNKNLTDSKKVQLKKLVSKNKITPQEYFELTQDISILDHSSLKDQNFIQISKELYGRISVPENCIKAKENDKYFIIKQADIQSYQEENLTLTKENFSLTALLNSTKLEKIDSDIDFEIPELLKFFTTLFTKNPLGYAKLGAQEISYTSTPATISKQATNKFTYKTKLSFLDTLQLHLDICKNDPNDYLIHYDPEVNPENLTSSEDGSESGNLKLSEINGEPLWKYSKIIAEAKNQGFKSFDFMEKTLFTNKKIVISDNDLSKSIKSFIIVQ